MKITMSRKELLRGLYGFRGMAIEVRSINDSLSIATLIGNSIVTQFLYDTSIEKGTIGILLSASDLIEAAEAMRSDTVTLSHESGNQVYLSGTEAGIVVSSLPEPLVLEHGIEILIQACLEPIILDPRIDYSTECLIEIPAKELKSALVGCASLRHYDSSPCTHWSRYIKLMWPVHGSVFIVAGGHTPTIYRYKSVWRGGLRQLQEEVLIPKETAKLIAKFIVAKGMASLYDIGGSRLAIVTHNNKGQVYRSIAIRTSNPEEIPFPEAPMLWGIDNCFIEWCSFRTSAWEVIKTIQSFGLINDTDVIIDACIDGIITIEATIPRQERRLSYYTAKIGSGCQRIAIDPAQFVKLIRTSISSDITIDLGCIDGVPVYRIISSKKESISTVYDSGVSVQSLSGAPLVRHYLPVVS